MENLNIEGSRQTPAVEFDAHEGLLKIEGRSIPENSFDFYEPVLKWLDEYINHPAESTTFEVMLEYFNTSSSKYILEIFKRFKSLSSTGAKVSIKWYYDEDDEEMMETGEDYQDVTGLQFDLIGVEED